MSISAQRLKNLPEYLFKKLEKKEDVIDLSIGDPDLPTPKHIIKALKEAVDEPAMHHYPDYASLPQLRAAIANYYKKRFNVTLDEDEEVLPLIGSKEGIAHLSLALLDENTQVLVPSPAYPVYINSVKLAGAKPYITPLLKENNFLPDLNKIPHDVLNKAKLWFLNYPNNPTTACCSLSFFEEIVQLAHKYNIIVVNDAAYCEIYFNKRPPSLLQVENAKQLCIEFNSLSKTYNMTGWRIGYVVGNKEIIRHLLKLKTHIDSGIFMPIQKAAIAALTSSQREVMENRNIYKRRAKLIAEALNIPLPSGTFYIWLSIPEGYSSSLEFSKFLLEKEKILVTPGVGFGEYGEGYIRLSLTTQDEKIKEAAQRLKKIFKN